MIAKSVRARGEHRRQKVSAALEQWFGPIDAHYAEAFQICEYGRVPSEDELRDLFPMTWTI
jgi:hypothetical protein